MNRAAQQRAAIRRLMETLRTSPMEGVAQQMVVDEARRLTSAASAALCLFAEQREMLDFVAASGENADDIVGLRIRVADSLSAGVLATSEPILLDGRTPLETGDLFAAQEETAKPALPPRFSEDTSRPRSAAVVPIFRDHRLIGTLSALNKFSEGASGAPYPAFDAEDLDILALLADAAALATQVHTTARTAREQSRELAVLYDAARTVASSLNVQEVMESVLTAICTHLEYHTATLFLLNDERTHLFISADRGLTEDEREIQLAVERGIPAQVLDSGLPRLIPDTDAETGFRCDFRTRPRPVRPLCPDSQPRRNAWPDSGHQFAAQCVQRGRPETAGGGGDAGRYRYGERMAV